MLIELGKEYNNVYHVDCRGIAAYYAKYKVEKPKSSWYDELHRRSKIFGIIAETYNEIIENKTLLNQRVINVIETFSKRNKH